MEDRQGKQDALPATSDTGIFLNIPHKKGSQIASKQANYGEIFQSSHIAPLDGKKVHSACFRGRKDRSQMVKSVFLCFKAFT